MPRNLKGIRKKYLVPMKNCDATCSICLFMIQSVDISSCVTHLSEFVMSAAWIYGLTSRMITRPSILSLWNQFCGFSSIHL